MQARSEVPNRVALTGAFLFCVYEALPRSLTTFKGVSEHGSDPIIVAGLTFVFFLLASIALRSPHPGDRVLFGAAALGTVLAIIIRLSPANYIATVLLEALRSLAWTIGAVAALVLLMSRSRRPAR